MRILFVLNFIFGIWTLCSAQEDSLHSIKFSHGINSGGYFTASIPYPNYNIDYTIEKRKVLLTIGIVMGKKLYLKEDYGVYQNNTKPEFKLRGMHSSLIVYPNTKKNIFNLFFQYDLAFINYSAPSVDSHYYRPNPAINLKESIIENTISYGVRINFLTHFYIYNSIGFGHSFSFKKYDFLDGKIQKSDFNQLTGLFKIGLGYKFQ